MRKFIAALLVFLYTPALAQQCGTVSNCPWVSLPLDGTELFYIIQKGISKKINAFNLAGQIASCSLTLTDGTNTVVNVCDLLVNNMVVGGSTPNATLTVPIATCAQIYAATAGKFIDAQKAAQCLAPVAVTPSGATYAPDLHNGINFDFSLTGCPCTVSNLANVYAGYSADWRFIQNGSGSQTVTWGSNFKWPGGTAPTLSTGANAVDDIWIYCPASNTCYGTFAGNFH